MSFLEKIADWVSQAAGVVGGIARKVTAVADAVAEIADAGRSLPSGRPQHPSPTYPRQPRRIPSFRESMARAEETLRVDEVLERVTALETEASLRNRNQANELEFVELILGLQSQTRYASNIRLHSANLQIHLQTIRNVTGLLDDVNRQRIALKRLMRTVNHLINVQGLRNKVEPIEGVDVEMRRGAISLNSAYQAFEKTQELLRTELLAFGHSNNDLRIKAQKLLRQASPDQCQWLTHVVLPAMSKANEVAKYLYDELRGMPLLERETRAELSEI
ncbi:MAG: hypothetical protein Q8N13_22520 [Acidovorax sp.]|nr:hypothetical protein [Acidovorax sp.]